MASPYGNLSASQAALIDTLIQFALPLHWLAWLGLAWLDLTLAKTASRLPMHLFRPTIQMPVKAVSQPMAKTISLPLKAFVTSFCFLDRAKWPAKCLAQQPWNLLQSWRWRVSEREREIWQRKGNGEVGPHNWNCWSGHNYHKYG